MEIKQNKTKLESMLIPPFNKKYEITFKKAKLFLNFSEKKIRTRQNLKSKGRQSTPRSYQSQAFAYIQKMPCDIQTATNNAGYIFKKLLKTNVGHYEDT